QVALCDRHLAPRQRAVPDYQAAGNYAYHLAAGNLAALLTRHATQRLGVRHLADHVVDVLPAGESGIAPIRTRHRSDIAAGLFVDGSGDAALLIGRHLGVEWIDRGDVLINDRALAAQVRVAPGSPVASETVATVHEAGWIWDIGLPGRRGIGC